MLGQPTPRRSHSNYVQVHAIKQWAAACPTAPSSYALTLMLIHFLQVEGVVPNLSQSVDAATPGVATAGTDEAASTSAHPAKRRKGKDGSSRPSVDDRSISTLLREFYAFVAEFLWDSAAISVRLGMGVPRETLRCNAAVAGTSPTKRNGDGGGATAGTTSRQAVPMVVEDPFNLDHNTTATLTATAAAVFIGCAKVARDKLAGGADFLAAISFPMDEKAVTQRADKAARQKLKKMMKRATIAAAEANGCVRLFSP